MSRTILIECSPKRPADGVVVPLRLAFKAVARANFLGAQWHPAVVSVPAFEASLGFDGRTFGAAPSPQIGELVFALTDPTRFAGSLVWANAAVTMKSAMWTAAGGDPADGDFTVMWTGIAEDVSTGGGQARVRLLDNGQALRVPVLAAKFGSTGDALLDGADALKDRSAETRVPRAWGKLLSFPGLLVDRANGIWLFAGNPATSVQAFYDGGAAFALGVARANLAALQANVPAAGAVDYCLDAGGKFLARPWTAPTYPFTAAATFGSTTAADIASAIVTGRTAVTFTAGTVAAFNALQGAEHGIYIDDETTVAVALDQLFAGLGAWWRLSSAGTITLGRWGWTTPTLTAAPHRRHAPDRLRIIAPTRRRSLGYARNYRVHGDGEIARILLAGDLAYADGTSIEALKPGEAGADVTGGNTAAAIAGQGALATKSSVDYSTEIIGPYKPITYRIRTRGYDGALQSGDVHVGLWNETTQVQIAGFAVMYSVCHLPPGSSTWQVDTFDTLNNPTNYRAFLGYSAPDRDAMAFRLNQICDAYRACPVVVFSYDEPASGRLSSGIDTAMYRCGASRAVFGSGRFPFRAAYVLIGQANAFEGNGAEYLAGIGNPLQAQIDLTFGIVNGIVGIAGVTPSDARDLVYSNGITIDNLRPFQVGADQTILNTAAALAGQGALATANVADWATQITGTGKPVNFADVTGANVAAAIAGQGALATLNTVDWATQVTGRPSSMGEVTVGYGETIRKYMTSGDTADFDGGVGATASTASFGTRYVILTANGSTFATGPGMYVGPSEPGQDAVSGTYTHSGAAALVTFAVGYTGAAIAVDYGNSFCRG